MGEGDEGEMKGGEGDEGMGEDQRWRGGKKD